MIASLLFAASVATGGNDATRLSHVFVDGCVQGRIAGSLLEEVPFDQGGKRFLRDLEGATAMRLYRIKGVEHSFFVFAQYAERPDGVERRCGVFSQEWEINEALRTVFSSPVLLGDERAKVAQHRRRGRLIAGSRHGSSYQSEIAYGREGRFTYMMMSAFDASGTARRLTAAELLGACHENQQPETGDCSKESRERAMLELRGYNGI